MGEDITGNTVNRARGRRRPSIHVGTLGGIKPQRIGQKPPGRVCADEVCGVILSRYNHGDTCGACRARVHKYGR